MLQATRMRALLDQLRDAERELRRLEGSIAMRSAATSIA
jgi:hypothetical protein